MKKLLVVLLLSVTSLCSAADGASTTDRPKLIAELSSRLKAQQHKLPDNLFVTGTGSYRTKSGRGAESPFVNTMAKEAGEATLPSQDYHMGVFTEGSQIALYEGLIRDTPVGMGSVAELYSEDFFKPTPKEGWSRKAYVMAGKPVSEMAYHHSQMDQPLFYFSTGVGPIRARASLAADTGHYQMVVNNDDRFLRHYAIEGFREGEIRILQLTSLTPVDGYFQENRFRFDDSRAGALVAQDYRLHNPVSGHVRATFELRCEYAVAPTQLVENGVPFVLTRYTTIERAAVGPEAELQHMQTEQVEYRDIRVTTTPPTPPEWYTEFEAQIRSSSDGQEEAAKNE